MDRKYIKPFLTVAVWDEDAGNCFVKPRVPHSPVDRMDVQLVSREEGAETRLLLIYTLWCGGRQGPRAKTIDTTGTACPEAFYFLYGAL